MNEVLNRVNILKKLTLEQNRALLADDIDLFLKVDEEKSKIRTVIDSELKNYLKTNNFNKSIANKFNILFREILKIEQSNNNIIQFQLQNLFDDKRNIDLNKKITKTYYSESLKSFNKAGSTRNLNKVL